MKKNLEQKKYNLMNTKIFKFNFHNNNNMNNNNNNINNNNNNDKYSFRITFIDNDHH